MKPVGDTIVRHIGSFGEDTRKTVMGIDPENAGHLMSLLTDMYKDKITAVLREYATNAWDSHVEAGVTRPIEVTLPTILSPYLKIRDFGIGLSGDDVISTYSQYGSSTKRGSDAFNGMLGIGAKSALTYTSTFTITSVKSGEKIIVSVTRNGDESTMEIIDVLYGVDEANGVEISIPAKSYDMNEFAQKAAHLYSFWKPGSVLVNGREPIPAVLDRVTDRLFTSTNYGYDIVVMGNVPYPVERDLYTGYRSYGNSFDIVAFVEIGEVNFTPAREGLRDNAHTKAAIESIRKEFADTITSKIVADIDAAPTHAEAYKRSTNWNARYASVMPKPVLYKGEEMPKGFDFKHAQWSPGGYRGGYQGGHDSVNIDIIQRSIFVRDFNAPGLTATHKKKIQQWAKAQGLDFSRVILSHDTDNPFGPWIDPKRNVLFSTIKAERLPSVANGGRGGSIPVILFASDGTTTTTADLDEDDVPVYVSPTARLGASTARKYYSVVPDIQIVVLGENRWEKFKRENPKAIPLSKALRDQFNILRDSLSAEDIEFLGMDYYGKRRLSHLDHNRIDDPDLAGLVKIANGSYKSDIADKYTKFCNIVQGSMPIPALPESKVDLDKYPLLPSYSGGTLETEHTILYLNAAYKAANP